MCCNSSRGGVGTYYEAEERTNTHLRQRTDKVQARNGRFEPCVQPGSTRLAMKCSTQLGIHESDAFDIDLITDDLIDRDAPLLAAD
jgi:hypothetical protein